MATQKNYKYEGGNIVETNENGMIGWEYAENGYTKRVVCESVGKYLHSFYAECKYVIQVLVNGKWVDYSRETAVVSKTTYCENVAPYNPVSEADAYEEVDDLDNPILDENGDVKGYPKLRQLKSNIVNEWDFYYPYFFDESNDVIKTIIFVKKGAEIKTGVIL